MKHHQTSTLRVRRCICPNAEHLQHLSYTTEIDDNNRYWAGLIIPMTKLVLSTDCNRLELASYHTSAPIQLLLQLRSVDFKGSHSDELICIHP